jgi:CheY-like chemotaxis protein
MMDLIPVNVLLVSDDRETVAVLSHTMSQVAMNVAVCSEARTAARQLCRAKFEGIAIDLRGGKRATDLIGSVHGMTSHRSAVVIAVLAENDDAQAAFHAGANFVLERPFLPRILTSTLRASYSLMLWERRRYFRCPVIFPVCMTSDTGVAQTALTVNISENGMALNVPVPLAVGECLELVLDLPDTGESARVRAEVCWANETGRIGLEFREISDEAREKLRSWLFERLRQALPTTAIGQS